MTARLFLFALAFAVGLFLGGCSHRVATDPPQYQMVHRGTYAYQRISDGEVVIEATDTKALGFALDEIGCGKRYICLIDKNADVFDVQLRKK